MARNYPYKHMPKPPTGQPPDDVWQPLDGVVPITLMKLENAHCRWPVHGGYCGCQKLDESSYCSVHNGIAKTGAPPLRFRARQAV